MRSVMSRLLRDFVIEWGLNAKKRVGVLWQDLMSVTKPVTDLRANAQEIKSIIEYELKPKQFGGRLLPGEQTPIGLSRGRFLNKTITF